MAALNINEKKFRELIDSGKDVLVDFWAPWCSYCVRINPAYEQIAEEYRGKIEVVKVNIDDEPRLARWENVELIPTLILYRNGEAVGSIVAPESKSAIEDFISESVPVQEKHKDAHIYDMAVVGGGPGGYTAALYAARAGMDVIVLEKLSAGGQMALSHQIDNYPGFEEGVEGFELARRMKAQAERFGAKSEYAEVSALDLKSDIKRIETGKSVYLARTVVIATGANPRELSLPNEKEFTGKGVAYCAACDGIFYKGKTVVVVGGGNTAAADAMLLSRMAKKVIIVHRRDSLRATKIYHGPLMNAENVEFVWNSTVSGLLGKERLSGIRVKNVQSGEEHEIACDGMFVSIGRKPATELVAEHLELDANGYIVAGENTLTSVPGVYAVGDVRTKQLRQVVTAVSDGAVAVHMAEEYLAEQASKA